jgi:LysM repeat protein
MVSPYLTIINNLTSTFIYPNQIPEVDSNLSSVSSSTTIVKSEGTQYTVQIGDTLWEIGQKFNK